MKGNIGKGTECFSFFGDLFKLAGDFWMIESNESYWDELIKASDSVLEKYKNCDFYPFAKGVVLILNVYLSDVKYKGVKKGTWQISYKAD